MRSFSKVIPSVGSASVFAWDFLHNEPAQDDHFGEAPKQTLRLTLVCPVVPHPTGYNTPPPPSLDSYSTPIFSTTNTVRHRKIMYIGRFDRFLRWISITVPLMASHQRGFGNRDWRRLHTLHVQDSTVQEDFTATLPGRKVVGDMMRKRETKHEC